MVADRQRSVAAAIRATRARCRRQLLLNKLLPVVQDVTDEMLENARIINDAYVLEGQSIVAYNAAWSKAVGSEEPEVILEQGATGIVHHHIGKGVFVPAVSCCFCRLDRLSCFYYLQLNSVIWLAQPRLSCRGPALTQTSL